MRRFLCQFSPVRCLFVVVLVISPGCGSDTIDRASVSGRVTLDGQPIPKGQIRFIPTNGPVWSAWIKDGRYTTEGTKGVPVGDIEVRIEAYRIPDWYKTAQNGAVTEEGDTPREQYLPSKYNLQSELKMTLAAGSEAVEKNWELTSQ